MLSNLFGFARQILVEQEACPIASCELAEYKRFAFSHFFRLGVYGF